MGQALHRFWHAGWRVDDLYDALWVRPYTGCCRLLRGEPVDGFYNLVAWCNIAVHRQLSQWQTGRLRWYATTLVAGVILLLGLLTGIG